MTVKIDGTLGINKVQDGVITSSSFADSVNLPGKPTAATAPSGTNNNQLATTGFVVGEKGGRRNYIINGNFDRWDYGTSQTTAGYGSDNRWCNWNNISTKTVSQQVCGDTERALFNAMYFSRTVSNYVDGTNTFVKKMQFIENINLLAGKTVTLSFWARSDGNKKACVNLVDFYGTGGTPSNNGTMAFLVGIIDLTTTWTRYSLTTTLPSIVGKTLGTDGPQTSAWRLDIGLTYGADRSEVIHYGMVVGQSGTLDLAQIKLEDGSVATDGWHPYDGEFGGEVEACGRYYEICDSSSGGAATAGIAEQIWGTYKYTKRVIPSVTELSVLESSNVGSRTFNMLSTYGYKCYFPTPNTGQFFITQRVAASSEF
jgi:hypothetical protein